MKQLTIFIALCMSMIFCVHANAQSFKDLVAAKKAEAKAKMQAKLDQKTSAGIDSAVNKPENMIRHKKKVKIKEKSGGGDDAGSSTAAVAQGADAASMSMGGDGAQTIIQTNILCAAGRKKVEGILKKQDGVFEVKTNINNGELAIRYSSDGTSYMTLLELINDQGFTADGNKPKAGAPANPCK